MRVALLLPAPPAAALGAALPPPPRAAAALAAWLIQNGHEARLIDAREPDPGGGAAASGADLVLIPGSPRSWPEAAALARACRAACDAPVGVFGPHPTLFPQHAMGEPAVDFAVLGDPEETVLQLLERLPGGEGIDGLAWRAGGAVVHGRPRRPFADLDALPNPAWDLVDRDRYALPRWAGPGAVLPLRLSRGCSHAACRFCALGGALEARYRRPDPERAAARVAALVQEQRPDGLLFVDEELVVGRDWTLDFTSALRRLHVAIPWTCEARPNQLDAGLLDRMKEAGCRQLVLGLEVLDSGLLRDLHKDQQVASCAQVLRDASQCDVTTLGLLVAGLPGSSPEADRRGLEHALASYLDELIVQRFLPVPGTEPWDAAGWGPDDLVRAARSPHATWAPPGYGSPGALDAVVVRLRRRWRFAPRRLERLGRRLLRSPELARRVARTAAVGPGAYLHVPGIDLP